MNNKKMNLDSGSNFFGFFASGGNILDVHTRECKKNFQRIFQKIAYERIADIHCKILFVEGIKFIMLNQRI